MTIALTSPLGPLTGSKLRSTLPLVLSRARLNRWRQIDLGKLPADNDAAIALQRERERAALSIPLPSPNV